MKKPIKLSRIELKVLVFLWHNRTVSLESVGDLFSPTAAPYKKRERGRATIIRIRNKGVPVERNTGLCWIPDSFKNRR